MSGIELRNRIFNSVENFRNSVGERERLKALNKNVETLRKVLLEEGFKSFDGTTGTVGYYRTSANAVLVLGDERYNASLAILRTHGGFSALTETELSISDKGRTPELSRSLKIYNLMQGKKIKGAGIEYAGPDGKDRKQGLAFLGMVSNAQIDAYATAARYAENQYRNKGKLNQTTWGTSIVVPPNEMHMGEAKVKLLSYAI